MFWIDDIFFIFETIIDVIKSAKTHISESKTQEILQEPFFIRHPYRFMFFIVVLLSILVHLSYDAFIPKGIVEFYNWLFVGIGWLYILFIYIPMSLIGGIVAIIGVGIGIWIIKFLNELMDFNKPLLKSRILGLIIGLIFGILYIAFFFSN